MMEIQKPQVVEAIAECLGDTVVFYFKAHGHHWNVTGSDFKEYHDFFREIASDAYDSIDEMAEEIRKLGAPAPFRLYDFSNLSSIEDAEVGFDGQSMIQDLLASNEVLIASLDKLFMAATNENEQGLADFIAGRISMQKKWRWQLKSTLKGGEQVY